MPDTPAIVGFVGFVRKYERIHGGEREEGDRERCSGGAQGRMRGQDREDSGSF
jgi:hypothetical protein